jgi:hypothetical protein
MFWYLPCSTLSYVWFREVSMFIGNHMLLCDWGETVCEEQRAQVELIQVKAGTGKRCVGRRADSRRRDVCRTGTS